MKKFMYLLGTIIISLNIISNKTIALVFNDQPSTGENNQVKAGLSTDNVLKDEKKRSNTFPYLTALHAKYSS